MRTFASTMAISALAMLAACSSDRSVCSQSAPDTVLMRTTLGDLSIALFPEEAPITVANFVAYVDSGFYDGTLIHRVVPGFVIQGGGFSMEGVQKETRPPITNEADNGLLNERLTLSMARRPDPNSATSQFFINLDHNEILDHGVRDFGYAVFGKVVEGMEIVDQIAAVQTANETPVNRLVIEFACRK
jgi:peptidyl-prolyl cis-trans isomerase A (cyclophilin A)